MYYGSSDGDLVYTVDLATGTASATGVVLDYSGLSEIDKATLEAMTANGATMHGLVRGSAVSPTASEVVALTVPDTWLLVEIDLAGGDVTTVADLGSDTRVLGLAWSR